MRESGFMKLVLIVGLTTITLGYQNCSQTNNFSQGSEKSTQSSMGNNGGTTTDNPKPTIDVSMGAFDPNDVQSAELCLREIRLLNTTSTTTTTTSSSSSSSSSASSGGTSSSSSSSSSAPVVKVSSTEIMLGRLMQSAFGIQSATSTSTSSSYSSSGFIQSLGNQPVTALPSGTYIQAVMIPTGTYNQVEIVLADNCGNSSMVIQNRNGQIAITNEVVMRFVGLLTITPSDNHLPLNLAPIMSALRDTRNANEAEVALDLARGGL